MKITITIIMAISIILLTSCVVVVEPPKFNIVGERTIIERQMIGSYYEIDDDKMLESSYKK
jgi:hypothetical protein